MRIGLIAPHYPPDSGGELELWVRSQVRELTARGHEVHVVAGCDWPRAGRDVLRATVDGSPVSYIPRTDDEVARFDLFRPRWTRACVEELRGVDLCHVFHGETLSNDLVRQLSRRMPVVLTLTDHFFTCSRGDRRPGGGVEACPRDDDYATCARCTQGDSGGLGLRFLEEKLREQARVLELELRAADRVLVPSVYHQDLLLERTGFHASVQPFGLCRTMPPLDSVSARGSWDGSRPLSMLYFGERRLNSGIEDVLAAVRELPRDRVELILCGPEVDRGLDDHLRASAGEVQLHTFGGFQTSQLATLASACDLVFLPLKTRGGSGLRVLEALALGLPVWATPEADPRGILAGARRGPVRALESPPGRQLAAGSPGAWRAAVEGLFEEPTALARERAAIPRSFETAADAAERCEGLYQELFECTVRKAS